MIPSAIDRVGLNPGAVPAAEPVRPPRAEREHDVTVSRIQAQAQAQAWSAVPSQGVQLPAPAPGVAQSLQPQTLANIKQLVSTVIHDSSRLTQHLLVEVPRLAAAHLSSPQAFEIELSRITGELESAQKANKLEDIKRAREQNLQKMDDNQKKIQESQDAAKEAQKSGLQPRFLGGSALWPRSSWAQSWSPPARAQSPAP
nr:type III secretion system translocon subunit SctE [Pseudomonas lundensis]